MECYKSLLLKDLTDLPLAEQRVDKLLSSTELVQRTVGREKYGLTLKQKAFFLVHNMRTAIFTVRALNTFVFSDKNIFFRHIIRRTAKEDGTALAAVHLVLCMTRATRAILGFIDLILSLHPDLNLSALSLF